MSASESEYVYLSLRDAKRSLNTKINLMAKVSEVGAVLKTRGSSYVLTLKLVDQFQSPPGIPINFFTENADKFPHVRSIGDIISLHQVEGKCLHFIQGLNCWCVDSGSLILGFGMIDHVSNSSPQKSPGPKVMESKNPVLPPLVVELWSLPRIMKSISFTGSPSWTIRCHGSQGDGQPFTYSIQKLAIHLGKNGTCIV